MIKISSNNYIIKRNFYKHNKNSAEKSYNQMDSKKRTRIQYKIIRKIKVIKNSKRLVKLPPNTASSDN